MADTIALPSPLGAAVFDLDGTLVDSSVDIAAALNTVLAANGAEPVADAQVRDWVGRGARQMIEQALGSRQIHVEHDVYPAFRAAYRARLTRSTRPYAGIVHLLTGLRRRGVPIAVCTNKPEEPAVALLAGLGMAVLVDAIVGADTTFAKKPHPEPVLEALRRVGVEPGRAVMVGDSVADVLAGRAAGVFTVGVTWGYGDIADADHTVDSVGALTALLLPSSA